MKSKISFRVGSPCWTLKERIEDIWQFISNYSDIIDEVAFFTHCTHEPLRLKDLQKQTEALKSVMSHFRTLGMAAGINILATIGHHEENHAGSLDMPWQHVVSSEGQECSGCYCPSDNSVKDYISKTYELLASAEPDFIWIDDDVRLYGHMPILCGCFCEGCIAEFSRQTGKKWTRNKLVRALNEFPLTKKLEVRKQWLAHNRKWMNNILSLAERATHNVDKNIIMGFMTGDRFLEGYDFATWANTLQGNENQIVKWRPGGGFYGFDPVLPEMVFKAHSIGRQTSALPDFVEIQSEIENFPHQKLKKGAYVTALEAAVYLGVGSEGSAFNILPLEGSLKPYKPYMEQIKSASPFYDLVASTFQRQACEGIWFAWNKDTFITQGNEDSWFGGPGKHYDLGQECVGINEIGIPCAYSSQGAKTTALHGDSVLLFEKHEIEKMLAGGVIIDGQSLNHLWDIGLGEYVGFKPAGQIEDDAIEVFDSHRLNEDSAGIWRNCRQSFKWWWYESGYAIEPVDNCAEILTHMQDYQGNYCGDTMGIFENSLGGRVAVSGYFPWAFIHSLSKSSQVKSVVKWLSRETIPAYISSFERVNIWCRKTVTGTYGVFLLNSSLDALSDIEIAVLTEQDTVSLFTMNCQEVKLARKSNLGEYSIFVIPEIKPWSCVLIKC